MPRFAFRGPTTAVAGAVVALGSWVIVAPPAFAVAPCDDLAPATETTVTCAVAGAADIAVPVNAISVTVVVKGAGGGGAFARRTAGTGGTGAEITGTAPLDGSSTAHVVVGGGGAPGVLGSPGAHGGGLSSVSLTTVLVVAGGGGGSGSRSDGGNAASVANGTGGAGGNFSGYGNVVSGGQGGGNGVGGVGGTASYNGTPQPTGSRGATWADGGAGGAGGAMNGNTGGGYGGDGYGGGGGGGASFGGGSAAGGGGGGSFASTVVAAPVFSLGGGAGGGLSEDGQGGLVSLTFHAGSPTLAAVSPSSAAVSGGTTITITGRYFTDARSVLVGSKPCAAFAVVSDTTLTCVLPSGVAGPANITVTTDAGHGTAVGLFSYGVAGSGARVKARQVTVRRAGVPTQCTLGGGQVASCAVTAYARVKGRLVVVGRGRANAAAGRREVSLETPVTLTRRGRKLADRPGGVRLVLRGVVRGADGRAAATGPVFARVVAPRVVLRPIRFAFDSARLTSHAKAVLVRLRHDLGPVVAITCVGHTDFAGVSSHELVLSRRRAQHVCGTLIQGSVRARIRGLGGRDPVTRKGTPQSRAANRYVRVTLTY